MKIIESLKKRIRNYSGWFYYHGIKVYFPRNSLIFNMACEQGVYEHTILNLILSFIKPDTFYLDVGSNIGLMSIPVLSAKKDCSVVSFEPSPNTVPYLLRTHAESNYGDRWIIVAKAAGEMEGTMEFHLFNSDLGAFDGFKSTGRFNCRSVVNVPVTTVDAEWRTLGCPAVSMIKIDVEGAEHLVIKGAQECIKSTRPYILLEWNIHNMAAYSFNAEDLLTIAENIGYEILTIPYLIPIGSKGVFRAQMCMHENFLLAPK